MLKLPLRLRHLALHHVLCAARFVEQPFRFCFRLAHDHLSLTLSGGARVLAQLLRRDQRFVHRFLAFPEDAQLLGQRGNALLQNLAFAHRALQSVGDTHLEVFHAQRVVAAQGLPEFLLADIERCQVEGVVVHGVSSLGPKRAVPNRITVAPS